MVFCIAKNDFARRGGVAAEILPVGLFKLTRDISDKADQKKNKKLLTVSQVSAQTQFFDLGISEGGEWRATFNKSFSSAGCEIKNKYQ